MVLVGGRGVEGKAEDAVEGGKDLRGVSQVGSSEERMPLVKVEGITYSSYAARWKVNAGFIWRALAPSC